MGLIQEPEPVLVAKVADLVKVYEYNYELTAELTGTAGLCLLAPIQIDQAVRYQGYTARLHQIDIIEVASGTPLEPDVNFIITKVTPGTLVTGDTFSLGTLTPDDLLPWVAVATADYLAYTSTVSVAVKTDLNIRVKGDGDLTSDTGGQAIWITPVLSASATIPSGTKFCVRVYFVKD